MADETLFGEPETMPSIDPEKDYFSELVGEGRKYKDPVAAGRALVEKDAHIARIEAENAQLRAGSAQQKSLQELVDQITSRTTPPDVNKQETPPAKTTDPEPIDATKVEDLVRKSVERLTAAQRAANNRAEVAKVLRDQFGPGFATVLEQKGAALGLGRKFIDDLAGTSPEAVFRIMDINAQKPAQTVPGVRVNPGTTRGGERKNFAYYEKLRLANPSKALTPAQNEEAVAAAIEQGDNFYR